MKFLYVAPRFHPNQVPIVEGLLAKGHEVRFAVSRVGATEKHAQVPVDVLPPARVSDWIKRVSLRKGEDAAERAMVRWYMPSVKSVKHILKMYVPDVIILRERNLFSLVVFQIAKRQGIKNCFLYNQSPVFEKEQGGLKKQIKQVWHRFFPKERITVCRYERYPEADAVYVADKRAHFLHFIPRPFDGSRPKADSAAPLRILDMGKYRPYKNHRVLLDAAAILVKSGITEFKVSVYGQKDADEEKAYYDALTQYAAQIGIAGYIEFHGSISYDRVDDLMLESDVFVLTSKRELANISILDAMSFGTVAVATDRNGTSDYIRDGKTGLIYESDNAEDLAAKLELLIRDRGLLQRLRQAGMRDMKENYSFESYYEKLTALLMESR